MAVAVVLSTLWGGVASARRVQWMERLPDHMLLSRLLIPGTHDSAAYQGVRVDRESSREADSAAAFANPEHYETQAWRIRRQLELGVRYLDVRFSGCGRNERESYAGRDARCFPTRHGIMVFKDNLADHVLAPVTQFLRRHPSEVVFLALQSDFSSGDRCDNNDNNDCDDRNYPVSKRKGKAGLDRLVLESHRYRRAFVRKPRGKGWGQLTVGEARGRIVLVDNLGWLPSDRAIDKPTGSRSQNRYEIDYDSRSEKRDKVRRIRALFKRARAARQGSFYVNYLSAVDTDGVPSDIDNLAVMGNNAARRWLDTRYLGESFGCWVLMDSIDDAEPTAKGLIQALIQRNWAAGGRLKQERAQAEHEARQVSKAKLRAVEAERAAKARAAAARQREEAAEAKRKRDALRPTRAEVKLVSVTGRCKPPMVQQLVEFGLNAGGKQCALPEHRGSERLSWQVASNGRVTHDGKGRRNRAYAGFVACLGDKGVKLLNRMRRQVAPCGLSAKITFR